MIVYAESSAVLAWLLGETGGGEAAQMLQEAEAIVSSELTLLECSRALLRAWQMKQIDSKTRHKLQGLLDLKIEQWSLVAVDQRVLGRARETFAVEPVCSLDAIHLATILQVHSVARALVVATFDKRVRNNLDGFGIAYISSPD